MQSKEDAFASRLKIVPPPSIISKKQKQNANTTTIKYPPPQQTNNNKTTNNTHTNTLAKQQQQQNNDNSNNKKLNLNNSSKETNDPNNKQTPAHSFVVFHLLQPRFHVGAVRPGGVVAEVTLLGVGVKDDGQTAGIGPTGGHTLQHAPGPQCPVPVGPGNHLPWAVGRFH